MTQDRLRIAIVGCGMASLVQYVPAIRYGSRSVVTALCDVNPEAMSLIGRYFPDAERFTDYDELLASDSIDAVLLITPPWIHRAQVLAAAAAGKHVFCEKPMAPTIADCDDMIAACAEAGVTLMVGFMKRFDKSLRRAKQILDAGEVGTPFHVSCNWSGAVPPHGPGRDELEAKIMNRAISWRGGLASGGGAFADWGAHTADLTRWWLGDIETVSGEFEIVRPGSQVDDRATGLFRHIGGATSTHIVGWSNKRWSESYQIDGSEGTLDLNFGPGASHTSVDPFRATLFLNDGREMIDETMFGDWSLDLEMSRFGRYTLEIDHFCECVQEKKEPLATGLDGRKATEAVNAVYLSAFLREKIVLPLESSPDLDELFTAMAARR